MSSSRIFAVSFFTFSVSEGKFFSVKNFCRYPEKFCRCLIKRGLFLAVLILLLTVFISLLLRSAFHSASVILIAEQHPLLTLTAERAVYFLIYVVFSGFLFLKLLPLIIEKKSDCNDRTPVRFLLGPRSASGARFQMQSVIIGAAAGFAIVFLLIFYLNYSSQEIPESQKSDYIRLMKSDRLFLVFSVVIIAVVTPLFEEIHYRFYLTYFLLCSGVSPAAAVILQGLLFGAAHPPVAAAFLSITGILLGFLSLYRGIAASITAHSVYNAAVIFLSVDSLTDFH